MIFSLSRFNKLENNGSLSKDLTKICVSTVKNIKCSMWSVDAKKSNIAVANVEARISLIIGESAIKLTSNSLNKRLHSLLTKILEMEFADYRI